MSSRATPNSSSRSCVHMSLHEGLLLRCDRSLVGSMAVLASHSSNSSSEIILELWPAVSN